MIVAMETDEIIARRVPDGSEFYTLSDFSSPIEMLLRASNAGDLMLAGFADGSLVLWRAADGVEIERWKPFFQGGMSLAVLPALDQAAVLGSNGNILFFDLASGQLENSLPYSWNGQYYKRRLGVSHSADGTLLAFKKNDTVLVKDSSSMETIAKPGCHRSTQGLALSPDGSLVACSGYQVVEVWDVNSGALDKSFNVAAIHGAGLAFSRDGSFLAAGVSSGEFAVWQTSDWQEVANNSSPGRGFIHSVAFSPLEDILAVTLDGVTLYSIPDGERIARLNPAVDATSLAFSPDGQLIAVGTDDGEIYLWDRAGTHLATLEGHSRRVTALAFTPDGRAFYSASADNTILAWGVPATMLAAPAPDFLVGHTSQILQVNFSPDQSRLISVDGIELIVWETSTWNPIHRLPFAQNERTTIVELAPDNDHVALFKQRDSLVSMYQISTGAVQYTLEPGAFALAFSPDGAELAVSYPAEGLVRIFNVADGAQINQLTGMANFSLEYSPDSQYLALVEWYNKISLLRLADGQPAWSYQTPEGVSELILSTLFSPDGSLVAFGGQVARSVDGMIVHQWESGVGTTPLGFSSDGSRLAVWNPDLHVVQIADLESRTIAATMDGCTAQTGEIPAVSFAPDGSLVACGVGKDIALIPLER